MPPLQSKEDVFLYVNRSIRAEALRKRTPTMLLNAALFAYLGYWLYPGVPQGIPGIAITMWYCRIACFILPILAVAALCRHQWVTWPYLATEALAFLAMLAAGIALASANWTANVFGYVFIALSLFALWRWSIFARACYLLGRKPAPGDNSTRL